MMNKEGSSKIVNFMTPGAGVLLLFLSATGHGSDILNIYTVVMITKEGSTEIVNLMTPGAGVLMPGRGHISHYSKYLLSSTLSKYSTLIAIALEDYDAAFLYHC